jgi:hypothetical protein
MLVMRPFQTHGQSVTRVEHPLKPFGCVDSDPVIMQDAMGVYKHPQRHIFLYIWQTLLVDKIYF